MISIFLPCRRFHCSFFCEEVLFTVNLLPSADFFPITAEIISFPFGYYKILLYLASFVLLKLAAFPFADFILNCEISFRNNYIRFSIPVRL